MEVGNDGDGLLGLLQEATVVHQLERIRVGFDSDEGSYDLVARLLERAGMDELQTARLMNAYALARTARQLLALPKRLVAYSAPGGIVELAGLLARAIGEDWEMPAPYDQ